MTHTSDQQYNRYRAGETFQDEMRRSWQLLPNWRRRLRDGGGVENPGDELILLNSCNILAEHKSTTGDSFSLSMLRENQRDGLIKFEKVLDRNLGMVFIKFDTHNEVYAFRLVNAIVWMVKNERKSIPVSVFRDKGLPSVFNLPRIDADGETCWDVRVMFKGV